MPTRAHGHRPSFFPDPASDRLMDMVVRLTGEISVLYDRVDTLETLLSRSGVLSAAEMAELDLDEQTVARREPLRAELVGRIFRILEKEREAIAAGDTKASYHDLMAELSGT